MVVAGFGNGLAFPMTVLIVQRYTSDRLRGRAFTLIISAHNALLGVAHGRGRRAHRASTDARWTYGIAARLLGRRASVPHSCSCAGSSHVHDRSPREQAA